jgi:hypothetical protein
MNAFYELMETDSQKSHLVTNQKDAIVHEEPRQVGETNSDEDGTGRKALTLEKEE